MTDVWRCAVCEGVNTAGSSCTTCGEPRSRISAAAAPAAAPALATDATPQPSPVAGRRARALGHAVEAGRKLIEVKEMVGHGGEQDRRDEEGLDRSDGGHVCQPFVAPAVRPLTMYFCVNRAMTMIGRVTIVAAAISPPQSMLA